MAQGSQQVADDESECDICEYFATNEYTDIFASKKLHEQTSEEIFVLEIV